MLIRRSTEDDVPALARIVSDNYTKETAEHFVTEFEQSFGPAPFRPWFYTAVDPEDGTIGCAAYATSWLSWGVYTLCWVNVDRMAQRRGVGRALVNKCIEDLRPRATLLILARTVPAFYADNWGFENLMQFANDQPSDTLMGLKL